MMMVLLLLLLLLLLLMAIWPSLHAFLLLWQGSRGGTTNIRGRLKPEARSMQLDYQALRNRFPVDPGVEAHEVGLRG